MSKSAKKRPRMPKANPKPEEEEEEEGKEDPKLPIILSSDDDDPSFKIVQAACGNSSSSATKVKKKISKTNGKTGVVKETEIEFENVEKKEDDGAPKESDATIEIDPLEKSNNTDSPKLLKGPGHFDPSAKLKKACNICGSLEHNVKQCNKGKDDFISKNGGHHAKDCPENSSWGSKSNKICLNCGDLGHEMFSCKNEYSLDDLKEIQCYVCKCFGHICCAIYAGEGLREVSCYRCGQLGHSGLECARVHAETNSLWAPTACFMCRQEAHMACKCTGFSKKQKRKMELLNSGKKKNSRCKRNKTQRNLSQPKPIGLINQDPRFYNHNHGWGSPNTSAMHISNYRFHGGNGYQPFNDRFHGYNLGYSNPGFYSNQGNFLYGSAVGSNGYQHGFPAFRFGNSSNYGNREHGWG